MQSLFLKIDVAEIVVHKANQPETVLQFFYADGLTGKDRTAIDFSLAETNAAAMRDDNRSVMEWVVDVRHSLVRTRGSLIISAGHFMSLELHEVVRSIQAAAYR